MIKQISSLNYKIFALILSIGILSIIPTIDAVEEKDSESAIVEWIKRTQSDSGGNFDLNQVQVKINEILISRQMFLRA